jgi:hypothetical protein
VWRCVDLASTDVSEERIASIFRVEKSASGEPAWAGGCTSGEPYTEHSIQQYVYVLSLESFVNIRCRGNRCLPSRCLALNIQVTISSIIQIPNCRMLNFSSLMWTRIFVQWQWLHGGISSDNKIFS